MKYYAEHVFMIRKGICFVIVVMAFSHTSLLAQQMAVGSWESHFSYAEGRHLAVGNGTVFCAAAHGLFSVKENIVEVIDKNRGLSGVSVSALNFFEEAQLLVIGYEEGIIDLVYTDHIVSIQTISNIEMITLKACVMHILNYVTRGRYTWHLAAVLYTKASLRNAARCDVGIITEDLRIFRKLSPSGI